MRFCVALTTLLLCLACHSLQADEKAAIDALLTFPLTDAAVPQEEVERFCEPKVARILETCWLNSRSRPLDSGKKPCSSM
ncbi:hypothetical protein Pla52o_11060 [Novipirellula galeiformis]|uniref:Uncharacterized protein n=1 Tax=Novipirellula galeiformis TaxID=2528004 RepID=A0A5C6CP34_9BACT|nr:hypothetical protein Pla52o_11060 [Novipirellula galeiformis]